MRKKEAVSEVEDSLFLFGYLMERYMRLSISQSLHLTFETASLLTVLPTGAALMIRIIKAYYLLKLHQTIENSTIVNRALGFNSIELITV